MGLRPAPQHFELVAREDKLPRLAALLTGQEPAAEPAVEAGSSSSSSGRGTAAAAVSSAPLSSVVPSVVFAHTLERAEEAARYLAGRGISVAVLHRDLTQVGGHTRGEGRVQEFTLLRTDVSRTVVQILGSLPCGTSGSRFVYPYPITIRCLQHLRTAPPAPMTTTAGPARRGHAVLPLRRDVLPGDHRHRGAGTQLPRRAARGQLRRASVGEGPRGGSSPGSGPGALAGCCL